MRMNVCTVQYLWAMFRCACPNDTGYPTRTGRPGCIRQGSRVRVVAVDLLALCRCPVQTVHRQIRKPCGGRRLHVPCRAGDAGLADRN